MTSERARPECDVRSRNALAAGTEQGSGGRHKQIQATNLQIGKIGISHFPVIF